MRSSSSPFLKPHEKVTQQRKAIIMEKITTAHQARSAYIYVRQSTPDQVKHNVESKRRQYNLKERAHALGWHEVHVIDDDLGRSGSGHIERQGFETLVAAICQGQVGAIFATEAPVWPAMAMNGIGCWNSVRLSIHS
jgi:hypothetical protein